MVLYFSGTGNSRYVARKIAETAGDELISINEKIKNNDNNPIKADGRLVFVTPTYAWRIPHIVERWIRNTEFTDADKAWFVMTCGGMTGNAAKFNNEICKEKNLTYMGTAEVVMPENYLAMFNTPGADEAKAIIEKAELRIRQIANAVSKNGRFPKPKTNAIGGILSSAVNPVFYRMIKSDPFYADERCISCGKCAEVCPLNNIKLKNGKPVWGKDCTHCMACICLCPMEAIEYGKKSVGKPRYHCD